MDLLIIREYVKQNVLLYITVFIYKINEILFTNKIFCSECVIVTTNNYNLL